MKLYGKAAIVTGGGSGVGNGICQCLAEEGADVIIFDINKEAAIQATENIKTKVTVKTVDCTNSVNVDQAVQEVVDRFGKVDILVNNVGGESRFYREKEGELYLEEEEWNHTIELNLNSTMIVSRAVAPYFVDQKSGKIVNIASIGGRAPSGMGAPKGMRGEGVDLSPMMSYGVAKAGVIQFTRLLALQLAEFNINVNCICPGVLYTPLYERSVPRRIQATPEAEGMTPREYFDAYVVLGVPLKREQTPEDIGRAVVFLASDDARNITGQSINVDGGMVPG